MNFRKSTNYKVKNKIEKKNNKKNPTKQEQLTDWKQFSLLYLKSDLQYNYCVCVWLGGVCVCVCAYVCFTSIFNGISMILIQEPDIKQLQYWTVYIVFHQLHQEFT